MDLLPTVSYSLATTEDCYEASDDMTVIDFRIAISDFNAVVDSADLLETPVLKWNENLQLKTAPFAIIPGVLPVTIIPDTTSPVALQFEFDMNTGKVSIDFDSPVNTTTVNLTALSFTNNNGNSFDVAGGVVDGHVVTKTLCLYLSFYTHTSLQIQQICSTITSCTVLFSENFISDPYFNLVVSGSLLQPLSLIPDTTRPFLGQFHIDMDSGTLTLFFDSAVDISSLNTTALFLAKDSNEGDTVAVQASPLADNIVVTLHLSLTLEFYVTLQVHQICSHVNSCFIFFSEDFISDPYSNPVIAISSANALLVNLIFFSAL